VFVVGWVCIVFFGFCGAVAVKRLFDTNEHLRVGSAGVCLRSWSDQSIPWSEIKDVTTWSYKGQKSIILYLRDPSRYPGRGMAPLLASAVR
jgi:hypothetical protein